jgi:hypothetical protein
MAARFAHAIADTVEEIFIRCKLLSRSLNGTMSGSAQAARAAKAWRSPFAECLANCGS